jgi:hypothetical protein
MNLRILSIAFALAAAFSVKVSGRSTIPTAIQKNDSVETEKKVVFNLHPSLGLTFSDSNTDGERSTNLQWLGTLNSDFDYVGRKMELSSTLFMQYGERKLIGQDAEKLQDAFILSITPSIPLIKVPKVRLFLETTAETNLGKGMIDDKETSFLDPLFLYQTLFLGQKHYSYQNKDNTTWELTYGLGYAFQQTLNSKFKILHDISGNKADFESGFSGIIEFNINSPITESLSFVLNAKAVALSRENFFHDFDASRRTMLVRSGLFYKKVGVEYNYHQVHDLNLSENDLVDQSIMFTISF